MSLIRRSSTSSCGSNKIIVQKLSRSSTLHHQLHHQVAGPAGQAYGCNNQDYPLYKQQAPLHNKIKNLYSNKQYEKALLLVEEAIKKDPSDHIFYADKGAILFELDRCEEAIVAWQHSVMICPKHSVSFLNMGVAYYELGQTLKALECIEQVVKLVDQNFKTAKTLKTSWLKELSQEYYFNGLKAYEINEYETARKFFKQSIDCMQDFKLQECDISPYHKLARTCAVLGYAKEAENLYKELIKVIQVLGKPKADCYNDYANLLYSSGQFNEAAKFYSLAFNADGKKLVYLYNLSLALFDSGDHEYAADSFQKALDLSDMEISNAFETLRNDPVSLDSYLLTKPDSHLGIKYIQNQGKLFEMLGEYEMAIEQYDEAIEIDQENSEILNKKLQALYLSKQYSQVLHFFNNYITLDNIELKSYLYNIFSLYALGQEQDAQDFIRPLSNLYNKEQIVDFFLEQRWDGHQKYLDIGARVLWEIISALDNFHDIFGVLLTTKEANFSSKFSSKDPTTLFSAVLKSENGLFIDQMFANDQDFSLALESIVEREDHVALELMKLACKYSPNLMNKIKCGDSNLFHLSLAHKRYSLAEYLLSLNTSAASQITDKNAALELMLLINNASLALELQQRFNFNLKEKLTAGVSQNNIELVNHVLRVNPDLVEESFNGMPFVHWVLCNAGIDLLDLAIEYDFNSESRLNDDRDNILTVSLKQYNFDVIELLLNKFGYSPGLPLVQFLNSLDSDKVIEIPQDIFEIALKDQSIIQFLEHTLNHLIRDQYGNSALHLLTKACKDEFIEENVVCLSRLVNTQNKMLETPLHLLLKGQIGSFDQARVFNALIKMPNLGIKIPDVSGSTALDLAAEFEPYMFRKFYDYKLISDIELANPAYSNYSSLSKDPNLTEKELQKHLLHYACFKGNLSEVQKLLIPSAYKQDDWGYLPLYYAVIHSHLKVIKFLLEEQQVCNIDFLIANNLPNHSTILHVAIASDNKEVIRYFFEQIAATKFIDYSVKGRLGRSFIHEVKSADVANYLRLEFEKASSKDPIRYQLLDINSVDSEGHNALFYAVWNGNLKLLKYWFKLAEKDPKKYSLNADTIKNSKVLCAAALKGDIDSLNYLLNDQKDKFSIKYSNLLESSIYNQGPKAIRYLFGTHPETYSLIEDPMRLKSIASFFGNQELRVYLSDNDRFANISLNVLKYGYKHDLEEHHLSVKRELEVIMNRVRDIDHLVQDVILSDPSRIVVPQTKEKLFGTLRRQVSHLTKGIEFLQQQQEEHSNIIRKSGTDEEARLREQTLLLEEEFPAGARYFKAFFYVAFSYFEAYRILSTNMVQTTEEFETNVMDNVAMIGLKVAGAAALQLSNGVPIVGGVVGCVNAIVMGLYKAMKHEQAKNKIQILNSIIKAKAPIDGQLSLELRKAGLSIVEAKKQEILEFKVENKTKFSLIQKKLDEIKTKVVGPEVIDTTEAVLATRDVAMAIMYLSMCFDSITQDDKRPLSDILKESIISPMVTSNNNSPKALPARRAGVFNIFSKVQDSAPKVKYADENFSINSDELDSLQGSISPLALSPISKDSRPIQEEAMPRRSSVFGFFAKLPSYKVLTPNDKEKLYGKSGVDDDDSDVQSRDSLDNSNDIVRQGGQIKPNLLGFLAKLPSYKVPVHIDNDISHMQRELDGNIVDLSGNSSSLDDSGHGVIGA